MIQIVITQTSKQLGSQEKYTIFNEETKTFKDMAEAKSYLKETYGNCKTVPMYQDKKDGTTVKSGKIFCFKNADWLHAPVEHWYQQDWVSFCKVTPITL